MTQGPPPRAVHAGLHRWHRAWVLGAAVAIFLFIEGPIWRKPFNWDAAIVWSYLAIPVLVAAALAALKRFGWLPWLLNSIEIVAYKFGLTALFLVGWLLFAGQRTLEPASALAPSSEPATRTAAQPASPLRPPPSARGDIKGRVTDAAGDPVAGALVYVSSGLEDLDFPPAGGAVSLEDRGDGFVPGVAAVQVGQPFSVRSADHRLHTFLALREDGTWIVNLPLPGSGAARTSRFGRPEGLARVRCTVHQSEPHGHLGIFGHPFFAQTNEAGEFTLAGVPALEVELAAFHRQSGSGAKALSVLANATVQVELSVRPRSNGTGK